MREDVAMKPTVAPTDRATMMEATAVVPLMEPVAWTNISMYGYPVGDSRTASMLPSPKRVARSMPKPRNPFTRMLVTMERGTKIAGFSISSDILEV